jgi:leucyl aminopeptidase
METIIERANPASYDCDCLVVGVFDGPELSPTAEGLDRASEGRIAQLTQSGDMDGKKEQSLLVHDLPGIAAKRVLLVGLGEREKFNEDRYRSTIAAAAKRLHNTATRRAAFCLAELTVGERDSFWKLRHLTEAVATALYRFDRLKSKPEEIRHPLDSLTAFAASDIDDTQARQAMDTGAAVAAGIALASDLGNLPGNICTPTYLADQAKALAEEYGMKSTILERSDMEALGMGALLSVSRGSRQPPKLIVLEYNGGKQGEAPVALVGKGLTFDAGGISLKPAANMDEMKYDMCGGASVLGALKTVAMLKLPINVVGVVPSSENLPDGDANKPGDIVTSMSGQTIEVLNTDAEGRLILCDALTYTERFKPAAVIDIATLTGACVIALGAHASAVLGNDEPLIQDLLRAGSAAFDRAWQLPLWDEYQSQLDSNFADMANIGGRPAGAITAACFLARYTKAYKWAHLDIAGAAWRTGKSKGATGRPVGLLAQYLIDRASG